jgi:hypothetical protein
MLRRFVLVAAALLTAAVPFAGSQPARANQACAEEFVPLRQALESRGQAVQAAIKAKRPREEICAVVRRFQEAENRLVSYMRNNQDWCMIPDEAVKNAAASQGRTANLRKQACAPGPAQPQMGAAPQPQRPTGPGLVESVGRPRLPGGDTSGPTFNTLMGNALSR